MGRARNGLFYLFLLVVVLAPLDFIARPADLMEAAATEY